MFCLYWYCLSLLQKHFYNIYQLQKKKKNRQGTLVHARLHQLPGGRLFRRAYHLRLRSTVQTHILAQLRRQNHERKVRKRNRHI